MERKRAAQQEETRRQQEQQRQDLERQRERERTTAAEDPRKLAQKQAIEKRRLELGKKDQQRNPQRTTNDLVSFNILILDLVNNGRPTSCSRTNSKRPEPRSEEK